MPECFSPGDRVAALSNTDWDVNDGVNYTESEKEYLQLYGHHGHVMPYGGCREGSNCQWDGPHVKWEGTHDDRKSNLTSFTDGSHWHMDESEIEHID